jgi:hypothetical protein
MPKGLHRLGGYIVATIRLQWLCDTFLSRRSAVSTVSVQPRDTPTARWPDHWMLEIFKNIADLMRNK